MSKDTTLKCEKHNKDMECMAGCSAHHSNWYCTECEKDQRIAELEEIERRWNNIQPQHVIMIGDTGHYVNTAVHDRIAELEEQIRIHDISLDQYHEVVIKMKERIAELEQALQVIADRQDYVRTSDYCANIAKRALIELE